jgi:hypothetical protein
MSAVHTKNWKLARRDLLKGLGVGAACLPLLRARRGWADAGAPKRFVVLQMSEGLRQAHWKPDTGSLMSQPLKFSVTPFEPHKADMIFIPGLNNPGSGNGHNSYGCVYYGLGSTGGGYKEPTGKTIDQVVADGLPKTASGRRSLHLHIQLERAPRSTTQAGGSRCFWTGQGQPINPIGDPYAIYREIFAGGDSNPNANPAEIKRLMAARKSVLDYVGSTLEDFKSRLGTEDRDAISAHHQSVRELELQLQSAPTADGKCGGQPEGMINIDDGASYPRILKAHLNLMVASLKCGITNVATLQTGDSSGNNINFAFVPGIPATSRNNYKTPYRNWHDLGHSPIMDGEDHKRLVDRWFMEQWAAMFTQMKGVPEAGGTTLFDNTITLIGNHMEEGANHNSNAIPWMLAGGKSMNYLNLGNCLSGSGQRVAAVMAGIAGAFGVPNPYPAPLNGLKRG